MIVYIKQNITWIRDIFTVCFYTAATVVAILTYRRARATVLQPIRNEVIKKQSEILVELLGILPREGKLIHGSLDYSNIAVINTQIQLIDLGFQLKEQDEIVKHLNDKIVGWTYVGESKQLMDVKIVSAFKESASEKSNVINQDKIRFDNAKNGIIEIDKIYLTKPHGDFTNMLDDYSQNPYLPLSVQEILEKIISDIEVNIQINMKAVLSDFLLEFSHKHFTNGEYPEIDPIGVYNNFNHNRISHEQDIKRLREAIRKYLMIDEKW